MLACDLSWTRRTRIVALQADQEACRHHDTIVNRLAVDVLDRIDALDDGF